MFRLMRSENHTLDHGIPSPTSFNRQIEVDHFLQLCTALEACDIANSAGMTYHYVLNVLGQEYFNETWID